MKKTLIASLIAAGLASAFGAQAADENVSPWLIRLRAINIDPDSSSTAGGAALLPENAISVQNRWAPEIDVSYFLHQEHRARIDRDLSAEPAGIAQRAGALQRRHRQRASTCRRPCWCNTTSIGKAIRSSPTSVRASTSRGLPRADLTVPFVRNSRQPASQRDEHELGSGPAGRCRLQADQELVPERGLQVHLDGYGSDEQHPLGAPLVNSKLDINPMVYGVGVGYRF